jgi:hypothetical protein
MEKLFDTFERIRASPSKHSEPSYHFLNQSNWSWVNYFKTVIEEWYEHFPRDPSFYAQFTSKIDQQHNSAYFELYMYSLVRKSGYNVTYHQLIGNRRMDLTFLYNQAPISIDCTLSGIPNIDPIIERIENEIEDIVESLKSPNYWISVRFDSANRNRPDFKLFKKFIDDALTSMQTRSDSNNEFNWHHKGWIIAIEFDRKTILSETTIASVLTSQGGGFLDEPSMNTLRRTLDSKRGSSYKVQGPYVIAINIHNMMLSTEHIVGALFGKVATTKYSNNLSVKHPYFYNNIPQNTSVSGILIVKGLYSSNMGSVRMELWENPWAKFPIEEGILNVTRISTKIDSLNRITEVNVIEGKQPFEILGIEQSYLADDL